MKDQIRIAGGICLLTLPLLAMLAGCGEPIMPEKTLSTHLETTCVSTTTETVTTTVTINPQWQENAVENYASAGGVVIQNVPHYTQFTAYFTACESIAAVTTLQYFGVNITLDDFIDKYLPRMSYPAAGEDGLLHGESPWEYFIGDPREAAGFGCYSTAIEAGINSISDGLATALRDVPLEDLCKNYIDKGQPVILWGTIGMAQPYTSEFTWKLPNGEMYNFVNPEHALVLIGYDDNNYYFSDSEAEGNITPYAKQAVQTAYEGLFQQAVVIDPLAVEVLPASLRMQQNGAPA